MSGFIKLLSDLEVGEAVAELDTALAEVVAGVKAHSKKGKLVLSLEFDGNSKQVEISYAYRAVVPERDRLKTIMYMQKDGSLSRRDPRQPELPFRTVAQNVDPTTGEIQEASNG